jgi:hypothetical protein
LYEKRLAKKSGLGYNPRGEAAMKILRKVPLFGFILVLYDAIVLIGGSKAVYEVLFRMKMMSGAVWVLTVSDLLVIIGLVCLFVEVYKATRPTEGEIMDHIFSTVIFIVFLLEFVLMKGAMTSGFFILTLMSLFDVIAGFTISIRTAKRDITLDRDISLPT